MAGRERSATHPPLTDSDRYCGGHGTNGSEMVSCSGPSLAVAPSEEGGHKGGQ